MSTYLHFFVSFGALLAFMGVIAAWLFRTAAAPLWAKVLLSSLTVATGCYIPFAAAQMMGYPVSVEMSALPDHAELVAFVAHDETKRVALWLRSGESDEPRAYETELTGSLKKTLQAAREKQARGGIAMLVRGKGKGGNGSGAKSGRAGDRLGIGDDQDLYILDESALSQLPPKE
jgi:hypothetical protein